jgi:hypothetical protein
MAELGGKKADELRRENRSMREAEEWLRVLIDQLEATSCSSSIVMPAP